MALDTFLAACTVDTDTTVLEDGHCLTPHHAEALRTLLTQAQQHGIALQPALGQSTHQGQVVLVSFDQLQRIKRIRAQEYLVTAETGLTVGQLNEALRPHNQQLALAYPPSRTLLSLVGTEPPSLSNMAFGTFRQQVVGIEALTGVGEPMHYGGEVVKNVTGYDMIAFYIGSRHAYGWATSLTLKTIPRPAKEIMMVVDLEQCHNALEHIHWLTSSLSCLNGLILFKLKPSFGWRCLIHLQGVPPMVDEDLTLINHWLERLGTTNHDLNCDHQGFEHWLDKLDWERTGQGFNLTCKCALPLKVAQTFLTHFAEEPWFQSADCQWLPGSRVIMLRWRSPNYPFINELETIQQWCLEHQGQAELVTIPSNYEVPASVIIPPQPQAIQRWSQRLNQLFNPASTLSPLPRQSHLPSPV